MGRKVTGFNMEIFPAIDLRGGKVVRLCHGDYNNMNIYCEDPLEIAKRFEAAGAKNLHVVDLDGAKEGKPVNFEAIQKIANNSNLFIEVGGGIRNRQRVEEYLGLGVGRVIIGTAAVTNFAFLEEMLKLYNEKIAVGVDTRNGKVAVNGWLEDTNTDGVGFCEKLYNAGVKTVIYTDIAKDGALAGTNLEVYKRLNKIKGLQIIASGGISFEEEIIQLNRMNIYGAIVGKAIYENKLDLKRVLRLAL